MISFPGYRIWAAFVRCAMDWVAEFFQIPNFEGLYLSSSLTLIKNLPLLSLQPKSVAASISNTDFALSKCPHLHNIHLLRGGLFFLSPVLTCQFSAAYAAYCWAISAFGDIKYKIKQKRSFVSLVFIYVILDILYFC